MKIQNNKRNIQLLGLLMTILFCIGIIYFYQLKLVSILGLFANITSLILWLPQAYKTWENRYNFKALNGVSYATQVIAGINTVAWCVYGLIIHSYWLSMGTVIILPLAVWTVALKVNADSKNHGRKSTRNYLLARENRMMMKGKDDYTEYPEIPADIDFDLLRESLTVDWGKFQKMNISAQSKCLNRLVYKKIRPKLETISKFEYDKLEETSFERLYWDRLTEYYPEHSWVVNKE